MNRRSKDIIRVLTQKELKARYKHHYFGYLWSISNPLAFALIYFLVFKLVMKVKIDNFPIFLITGLFPWQWIANSIGVAPSTFLNNSSLIKKVVFPKNLLSLVVVLQDMIHFLISIPIIIIMLLLYDRFPSLNWLIGIPVLILIQTTLTYSINLFGATLNLFLRDIDKLFQMALTFLFFLTPVVYDHQMIPDKFKNLIYLNPFASLVISWRDLFMNASLNYHHILVSACWALSAGIIAHLTFKKMSWRLAEAL